MFTSTYSQARSAKYSAIGGRSHCRRGRLSFPLKTDQTSSGPILNGKSYRRHISGSSPKGLFAEMGLFLRGHLRHHYGYLRIRILE